MGRGSRSPIVFELDGDIKAYEQKLASLPGVTEKEAKKAAEKFVKAQRAGYLRAELEGKNAAKEVASSWGRIGDIVAGSLSSAAITSAVSSLASYVGELQQARTEHINLSAATGVSLETIAGLERAAGRAGVEVGAVTGSLGEFGHKLFEAAQGSGGAAKALEVLGVEAMDADGSLRDTDDVLREVLNKLPQIEDDAKRAAVAQELFGGAGKELNAVLRDAPLDAYIAQARALGTVIDDEAVRSTKDWNAATSELKGAIDGIVGAGADYVNMSDRLGDITTGLVVATTFWGESIKQTVANATALVTLDWGAIEFPFAEVAQKALDAGAATVQAREALDGYGDAGEDASKDIADLSEVQKKAAAEREKADRAAEAAGRKRLAADREAAAEEKKRADERQREFDEQMDAIGSLTDLFRDASSDQVDAYQAIANEERERMDRLREIEGVLGESAATEAAAQEIRARAYRDASAQIVEDARALQEQVAEIEAQAIEAAAAATEQRKQLWRDVGAVALDMYGNLSSAAGDLFGLELDYQARLGAAVRDRLNGELQQRADLAQQIRDAGSEEERAALERDAALLESKIDASQQALIEQRETTRKLFNAQKALSIGSILMTGAQGAIAALAPPPVGAGPLFGAALAVTVGAATAAQVAVAASQQAPQFHDGGLFQGSGGGYTRGPDEVQATLRTGESVLNTRATQKMGDQVRQVNDTGNVGGGPTSVALVIGGRQLGVAMVEELAAGREFTGAFNRRARIQPSRRPVYSQ